MFILTLFFTSLTFGTLYVYNNISNIFKNTLLYLNYKVDPISIDDFPSKIIMVSSHTTIYDFIIGAIFYYGYLHKRYDTYVLMKKEFERVVSPILWLFDSKFKLISVVPSKKQHLTAQIVQTLQTMNNYILYLAPEGTRKCNENLRTGYWVIAKELKADIVYIGIDYMSKTITLEKSRKVMENWEDEKYEFIKSVKKYVPLYPERCYWTKDFYNPNDE